MREKKKESKARPPRETETETEGKKEGRGLTDELAAASHRIAAKGNGRIDRAG